MADERRNPYLILGLDYGASKDEARRAAARVLRRVKTSTASLYTAGDVTWALHQIEHINDEPEAGASIFRVPAHPRIFDEPAGDGLFRPAAAPQRRSSAQASEDDLRRLARDALRELASLLLLESAREIDTWPTYEQGGSQ